MESTFEQSLKELEQVVGELEKGDLTLDKAIENFEKGIGLAKACSKKLDEAEKKINILVKKEDKIEEEAFAATE